MSVCGSRGSCLFVGLLLGFVSLRFRNPQTHIFKLRAKWQPRFHVLNGNPVTYEGGRGSSAISLGRILGKSIHQGVAAVVF